MQPPCMHLDDLGVDSVIFFFSAFSFCGVVRVCGVSGNGGGLGGGVCGILFINRDCNYGVLGLQSLPESGHVPSPSRVPQACCRGVV